MPLKTVRACRKLSFVFLLVCNAVFGLSSDQLYIQGYKAFAASLWKTASSHFAQFIREYPEDPRADSATYFGAVAYYKAKDFQRCLKALSGFDKRYPKSQWLKRVSYWDGLSRYALEDWTGALVSFERQIEFSDESAYLEQSMFYLGASLENLEDWKGAEAVYLRLMDRSESEDLVARTIFRLGQVQLLDGRSEDAIDAFGRLVSEYPEFPLTPQSSYWIAEAWKKMGEREKALKSYRDYIMTDEESPYMSFALLEAARLAYDARLNEEALHYLDMWDRKFKSGIDEEAETVLRIRTAIYLRMGRIEDAQTAYLSITPGNEDEEQIVAFNLAQTWLGTEETIQAVPYLEKATIGPDKRIAADAAFLAGNILVSNQDERGAKLLESFANQNPEDERREEALRLAFASYRKGGMPGRAETMIETLIHDYPKSAELPSYLFLRGELALSMGDSSAALRDYGIIVKNHSKSPVAIEANSRIGFIYSERKEYIRAADYYARAIEASGGIKGGEAGRRAVYSAAVAYLNGGMNAEAIALLNSIVKSNPEGSWSVESAYHLGKVHYDEGRYVEARKAYQSAIRHASGEFLFDALYETGWTWFRQFEWDNAAKAFEDAAKSALDARQKAKAQFRVGMSLASGRKWEEALVSYDSALLIGEQQWREEALYQKAWALLNLNRIEEANRTARMMSEEFPNSNLMADLPFRMGENAMRDGRFIEAIRWYDRTRVQYPGTETAIRAELRAALAAKENGDVVDASKRYGAWVINHLENPSTSAAIRSWAQMLRNSGNSSLAVDAKNKIIDSLGNNLKLSAPIILAWARLVPPDSTVLLETIAKDESLPQADRSESLLLIAHSYLREGGTDRSREIYEVLVRDIPGRIGAEAQEGLARSYFAEGNLDEAAEAYMAILYLFPNQQDLVNNALREAEKLFREVGRLEEADKIRESIAR
ncbi:hypothetical protein S1OALGB6SA_2346 [Olavius algarvensis spirochete endosymbiont]|nr:hypothetical protein S1OALGB6SA_2346 [Olavius algarvensis spirochete endosymbiont]